jgi:hypothetical protein
MFVRALCDCDGFTNMLTKGMEIELDDNVGRYLISEGKVVECGQRRQQESLEGIEESTDIAAAERTMSTLRRK